MEGYEIEEKPLTRQQQKALHKLFGLISEDAYNKGVTVRMMMSALPNAEIPMSPVVVKEVWRPFQRKLLGKNSTKELTVKDIDRVYEPFIQFMAERFDISRDFPSVETIMAQDAERLRKERDENITDK
jgi:hypothetical protein